MKCMEQSLPLVYGEPVSDSNAMFPYTLHSSDARSEIRAEEAGIRGLVCEPANRRQAKVDC